MLSSSFFMEVFLIGSASINDSGQPVSALTYAKATFNSAHVLACDFLDYCRVAEGPAILATDEGTLCNLFI